MHIAIVSETWSPEINGVALTVANLTKGLRADGHSVQVVRPRQTADAAAPEDDALLVRGMRMPRYPGLQFGLPAARHLRAAWKRRRPDAIYVATEGPLGFSAMRVAAQLSIPASSGFHTRFDDFAKHYWLGFLTPLVFAYLRYFHNLGSMTIVPTVELFDFLRERGIGNGALLPRAVDTRMFSPARRDAGLREDWELEPDQLAVIYVGRIAQEKNLLLGIRAFRAIKARQPGARYVFVGDGPMRAQIARENPDFIFAGLQRGENLARHFASADLFLFASMSETFGNVTLEALASGVPLVAFDYAAAHEYLTSECGAKVALGDDDGFMRMAVAVAEADRVQMKSNARNVVAKLDPRNVSLRFAELMKQVIAQHAEVIRGGRRVVNKWYRRSSL